MNVPQLRFKEFSGEWKETHLIKLAEGENLTNGVFNDPSKVGQGYKLINVLDMYIEGSINEYNLSLVDLDLKEFERNKVKNGDIFFTRSSLVKEGIAHSNVYLGYSEDVTFDGHLVRCSPNKELVTPIFFNFLLKTAKARKQLVARGKTATMTTIGQTDIAQILVDTPTLPEQTKIANFLTTIDERINQLTRKKELMTQYKQGVMQQIFSQQLRFKDDNGEDFEDWEEKNGNFLFAAISNKDHNSDLPILAITQEHGAIPRDLIDYRVSVSDKSVETYKVVEVGDFIISLRSFQGGIEYSNYKGICSPAYLILRSKTQLNSYFYKSYFKTPEYITKLNQHLEGIRDGKMVSYKQFSEILLPLPCLAEQTKIANFLTALDEKIQHIAKQIEATKQYKQGLLQQMFV